MSLKKGGRLLSPVFLIRTALFAASAAVLIINRELFFRPSVLGAVQADVPFEHMRPAVFFVLLAAAAATFVHAVVTAAAGRPRASIPPKVTGILALPLLFGNAAAAFGLVELVNNYYIANMEARYVWLGIAITFAFFLFFAGLLNSLSGAVILGQSFFLTWSCVNYFVQQFRGIPFQWIDFGSVRTAASVSVQYVLSPNWQMAAAAAAVLSICSWFVWLSMRPIFRKLMGKILSRAGAAAVFLAFFLVIFRTDYLKGTGIWLREWQPWYTYRLFGMEAGFLAFAKESFPREPEGYSGEKVKEIIAEAEKEAAAPAGDYPVPENIVVIMNESFSDLTMYPNFSTDVPVIRYVTELRNNTQSGKLLVSVKGGTTANTEYEFLTGNSCVLSPTTVVYNSYIKQDQFSLVRVLKDQGYRAVALHPYGEYGWNRNVVYPRMGFDSFLHLGNSFENAEKLRGFVSDAADYREIIRQIEGKEKGEKLFLFNITMQNHGSYKSTSMRSTVEVENFQGVNKGQAEQYCSLIRISDEEIIRLLAYFNDLDENTLVLFFGDHQPEIGDDFWTYCHGKAMTDLSFEEQETEYLSHFFFWANYDIPEKEDMMLSVNYLSSYLLSLTGLKMSPYESYLLALQAKIPVMNAFGYRAVDGSWHAWNETNPDPEAQKLLNDYKCLIYNELTEGGGRDPSFFGLG